MLECVLVSWVFLCREIVVFLRDTSHHEIPDNFLFDKCVTLHIDEANNDQLPGYDDVWNNILDIHCLEYLTNLSDDRSLLQTLSMKTHKQ